MGRAGTVGIVVPCHDVARYLDDCLDSLRRQTAFDDCTVVVVDDGSTDDTGRIAAAAAAADPRIHLISQPNAGPGPGAARNRGLDALDTEFVMFCDGDDELTPRAVELLRGGVQEFGLDLAVGASEQFPSPRRWLWSDYFEPGTVRCTRIDDVPLLAHNAATGNKLFRTRLLRERGWRFAEGIHHQDTVVTVPAMVTSAGLALVGDVVHRYRKRPEGGSIMDSHYTRLGNYWDHLQVIETLGAQLDDLDPARRPLLEAFIVRSFQGFAWRAPEVLPAERLEEFFGRARAVIRQVSPAALEAGTRHAGERAAYVTMREGDLAAYRRLPEGLSRVEARRGHLVLTVPARRKAHRSMLRAGNTRAVVDGLTATQDGVTLALRIRVRGVRDLRRGVNAVVLRLLAEGSDTPVRSVELELADATGELEGGPASEGEVTALAALSLPGPGPYRLRAAFRTPTGESARWIRLPVPQPGLEEGGPVALTAVGASGTLQLSDDGRSAILRADQAGPEAGQHDGAGSPAT